MDAGAWPAETRFQVGADAFGHLRQSLCKALFTLMKMNIEARGGQCAEAQRRIVTLAGIGRRRQRKQQCDADERPVRDQAKIRNRRPPVSILPAA